MFKPHKYLIISIIKELSAFINNLNGVSMKRISKNSHRWVEADDCINYIP
jgi:hypothetical protein